MFCTRTGSLATIGCFILCTSEKDTTTHTVRACRHPAAGPTRRRPPRPAPRPTPWQGPRLLLRQVTNNFPWFFTSSGSSPSSPAQDASSLDTLVPPTRPPLLCPWGPSIPLTQGLGPVEADARGVSCAPPDACTRVSPVPCCWVVAQWISTAPFMENHSG